MISACSSGAKVKVADIKYLGSNKVFLLSFERNKIEKGQKNKKINSICRFDFVDKVKSKNIDQKNIYLTVAFSFVLVGIFSILPLTVNFVNKSINSPKEIKNYSKQNLEKILSGENLFTEKNLDDKLNQKYL